MDPSPSRLMEAVRKTVPLVHHITNYVTVNDCANICICAGGSPVMTDAREDIPDMVPISSAIVLNIGTLNARTVDSMILAADISNTHNIPIILDPVGAGATPYRTEVAEMLMSKKPCVIKGNAGEIGVLSGLGGEVKGVDSVDSNDTAEACRSLAERTGSIVAATGKFDYVSDGKTTYRLANGVNLLGKVSGTGCMLSSVVGCYVGACGQSLESVISAITVFNIAAEKAEKRCNGPGTFKIALLDALESITNDDIDSNVVCEMI